MSLKFCNGGSKIKFSHNNECCVPYCGATRESNRTLPFYTLPTDATLRQEWLDLIKIRYQPVNKWENVQSSLMVCSKHFQPHNGGMKLFIDKTHEVFRDSSTISDDTTSKGNSSTYTQTHDDDWIVFLKQNYPGIRIKCNENIQCRTCTRFTVPTICIYDERNLVLNLEHLVNTYLSIKVKPTDTKPLNICVECFFKLKQFADFSNCCDSNDKLFDISNNETNNSYQLNLNKSNNNEDVIVVSDSDDTITDDDCSNDLVVCESSDESTSDKILLNPQEYEFIKKESRKHKIKILVSSKTQSDQNNVLPTDSSGVQAGGCTNKVIEVEFIANYIVSHGVEWVYEISVNEDQVKACSPKTIDHILKVISSTMKKQCDVHNSKVVPFPVPQSVLDETMLEDQTQIRTTTVIMDGKINNE